MATDRTDGFERYHRSLEKYNFTFEVRFFLILKKLSNDIFHFSFLIAGNLRYLGWGQEWRGGDMKRSAGGGQKVNILVRELAKYKNDNETILMFTDR